MRYLLFSLYNNQVCIYSREYLGYFFCSYLVDQPMRRSSRVRKAPAYCEVDAFESTESASAYKGRGKKTKVSVSVSLKVAAPPEVQLIGTLRETESRTFNYLLTLCNRLLN